MESAEVNKVLRQPNCQGEEGLSHAWIPIWDRLELGTMEGGVRLLW